MIRDYDRGELVCTDCGYVLATKIVDSGPEWRAFDEEQKSKRARVGAPFTFVIHDKGLSTWIDRSGKGPSGKHLNPFQQTQASTLRKWQQRLRVIDASEKSLTVALTEMSKITGSLNLPRNLLETAAVIYRKAVKKKLVRGRSIRGLAAGAVYMACRMCAVPRTLDEVAMVAIISRKDVGKCYRILAWELEKSVPSQSASRYISKFYSQMGVGPEGTRAEVIAQRILETARSLRLTCGRGPSGLASAALYISLLLVGERRTQREIAEAANVTEVTVRNRYQELVGVLDVRVGL